MARGIDGLCAKSALRARAARFSSGSERVDRSLSRSYVRGAICRGSARVYKATDEPAVLIDTLSRLVRLVRDERKNQYSESPGIYCGSQLHRYCRKVTPSPVYTRYEDFTLM